MRWSCSSSPLRPSPASSTEPSPPRLPATSSRPPPRSGLETRWRWRLGGCTVAGVLHRAVAAASPRDLVSPSSSIWTENWMEVAPWRLQADTSVASEAAHTSGDGEQNGNAYRGVGTSTGGTLPSASTAVRPVKGIGRDIPGSELQPSTSHLLNIRIALSAIWHGLLPYLTWKGFAASQVVDFLDFPAADGDCCVTGADATKFFARQASRRLPQAARVSGVSGE